MTVQKLTTAAELDQWSAWVNHQADATLWQSPEWKHYQESLGRETRVYGAFDDQGMIGAALVIIDQTMFGLSTWDIPRGPLEDARCKMQDAHLLHAIIAEAKQDRCMSIYMSPLITNHSSLTTPSNRHEQPDATRILDLGLSDDQLLAQMHQKGRYNIKVAQKNGVIIKRSDDIDAYYAIAQKTSSRDGFGIPSKKHLQHFLSDLPGSFLLLAHPSGSSDSSTSSPIAGLLGVIHNNTGIYYYGASDYEHRSVMAPYLLQWEAIKICKESGCHSYDLLGIAPTDAAADHPWQGISGFKEKFGGTVVSYPSEQEIRLRPIAKTLINVKRRVVG